ncbi:hypothetical protein [Vibrio marisflavi]|uniref:hypothetical protein n=1 Tax=Vibrio marisflavi TaxID=1216040 RepID=UPI001F3F7E48|nr:hypothetical protein [Vibrio marisflavi]
MAKLHGVETCFTEQIWRSSLEMPELFPHLITLQSGIPEALLSEMIEQHNVHFIKDSFADLDLTRQGFTKFVDAHWYIATAPTTPREKQQVVMARCYELTRAADLTRWEELLRGNKISEPIYPETFLSEPRVKFFTAEKDALQAGLSCFCDDQTVGIYNLWGDESLYQALLEKVFDTFPNKAIVGYGDQSEAQVLQILGFDILTPVSIWGKFF